VTRRGTSRAEAIRRAHEAKAQRDAARKQHEADIEAALADYYQAAEEANRIRSAARRRADATLADAERAATAPDRATRDAVRRLRNLLGGAAEVAELCGIGAAAVRELLAKSRTGAPQEEGEDR
jgi:predicted phage gp36 major capsid-like protein